MNRSLLQINIAVFLFGLAGLFARWVRLPALGITFGRVLFSSLTLFAVVLLRRQPLTLRRKKDRLLLPAAGGVLALHWWAFLASIQLSSVAVGTITFSAFPLFVTFLEPLVFRKKLRAKSILTALVILAGVAVTVPLRSPQSGLVEGAAVGMVSSLAYAVLTVMNKDFSRAYPSAVTAFWEQAAAAIFLLPLVLAAHIRPTLPDVELLLLLGVVATALAHTLFIRSLQTIPARLAGVCSSLETVYGIALAFLFLGERPSVREILGAAIILASVIFAQKTENETEPS